MTSNNVLLLTSSRESHANRHTEGLAEVARVLQDANSMQGLETWAPISFALDDTQHKGVTMAEMGQQQQDFCFSAVE